MGTTANLRKGSSTHYLVTITFRWPDGSQCRDRTVQSFKSRACAIRWGKEREAIIREWGKEKYENEKGRGQKVPTFAEFAPKWFDKARAELFKESSIDTVERGLRNHILPFIGDLRLDEITETVITDLRQHWTRGDYCTTNGRPSKPTTCKATQNRRVTIMLSVLHLAIAQGVIEKMPCVLRKLKDDGEQEAQFYERDTVDRLVAAAAELDPRYLAVLLLGCDAGLRMGEMMALTLDDIDYERSRIHVRRSIYWRNGQPVESSTKGGKAKPLPMTPRLRAALAALPVNDNRRLLNSDGGGDLTPAKMKTWICRVERKAGCVVTARIHILRHTFVSQLAMAGVAARVIQAAARHATLGTTMRYMHLARGAVGDGIENLARWYEQAHGSPAAVETALPPTLVLETAAPTMNAEYRANTQEVAITHVDPLYREEDPGRDV